MLLVLAVCTVAAGIIFAATAPSESDTEISEYDMSTMFYSDFELLI